MDSGGLFRAIFDGALRRVSGAAGALRGSTALAVGLLAGLAAAESAAQPTGQFREEAPTAAAIAPGLPTAPDSITSRWRLVAIDFGQLAPSADTFAAVPRGRPPCRRGVLTLNLFDDASLTGLVRSVAGGYLLSSPGGGRDGEDDPGGEQGSGGGLGADARGDLPHPAGGGWAARRQPSRSVFPLSAPAAPAQGGPDVTVMAMLDEPAPADGTVVMLTVGGTATLDTDYTLSATAITIAEGRPAGTVVTTVAAGRDVFTAVTSPQSGASGGSPEGPERSGGCASAR